jgi:hypothetical protein
VEDAWDKASEIYSKPWTLEQYPVLDDWVKDMDKPLDALAEIIRKPVYYAPFMQSKESIETGEPQCLFAILLPDAQLQREIARHFCARAAYRIGKGDVDGAIEDKLTAHRLGRLIAHDRTMIHYLIGLACENIASAIPIADNPRHPLTEKQIRRLLDGLDSLPPRQPRKNSYESDRFAVLDTIQNVATGKLDGVAFQLPNILTFPYGKRLINGTDWDVVYQHVNEVYDACIESPTKKTMDAIEAEQKKRDFSSMKTLIPVLASRTEFSKAVADVLLALFWSPFDPFEEAVCRADCRNNMQRLTLAISLYQLENGKMPEGNWIAKIEKYLGKNPEKYYSCPSNPAKKGETSYALVEFGSDAPDALLLIELTASVPYAKATVTPGDVLDEYGFGIVPSLEKTKPESHPGGRNIAHRNTAVRHLNSWSVKEDELRRMLGWDKDAH